MRAALRHPATWIALIALVVATGAPAHAARAVAAKIDGRTIKDGTITAVKLQRNSIGSVQVRNGALLEADLAPAVRSKLDGSLGAAGGDLSGTYPNPMLADGAVDAAALETGAVTGADIAAGTVTADKLAPIEAWRMIGMPGQPSFSGEAAGWQNLGSGETDAAFRRDRDGIVHLQGEVGQQVTGGFSAALDIFTLPEGYRPSTVHRFSVVGWNAQAGPDFGRNIGWVLINPSGLVELAANTGADQVTLAGMSFPAGG